MSNNPHVTAGELYQLVCTLQQEQRLTQAELRAVQKRSEAAQQDVQQLEESIAAERERQDELVVCCATAREELRAAAAEAKGAARATVEAVAAVREARAALVRRCQKRVASCATRPAPSFPTATAAPGAAESECDTAATARPGAAVPDEGRTCLHGWAPSAANDFLAPAVALELLTSLHAKLQRCLTELQPRASPASCPANRDGTSALTARATNSTCNDAADPNASPPTGCSLWPSPRSTSPPALADGSVGSRSALTEEPTGTPERKRIGFAPEALFQRVTAVPASNFNRGGRRTRVDMRGASQPTPTPDPSPPPPLHPPRRSEPRVVCCVGATATREVVPEAPAQPPRPQPRRGAAFTVRVASRSASLVAEAAALDLKRRRAAAEAADVAVPGTARYEAQLEGGVGDLRSSTVATSTAGCEATCSPLGGGGGAGGWPRFVAPVELAVESAAAAAAAGGCGEERSSIAHARRRTVWTWSRSSASPLE